MASFSDFAEGVIYTVSLERDDIQSIEYVPSRSDCDALVKARCPGHGLALAARRRRP